MANEKSNPQLGRGEPFEQHSLKKSLYLGLAAVSFVAAGAAASTTNASAKTYAKVTSLKSLKTDANTRNVVLTGSNAVATKAATLKGAHPVLSASKAASNEAADKTGNYNFRAYAVATTNRGSVYYKVVSFDKTVRGWIYGGNSTATYAGGVKQFATASDAKTESKSFTYNGQKLWAEPAWTQYKVGASKLTMTNGTSFTVNASKTNVKSGDLYYQIADGSAKGAWVKASDLETATTPIANNQVGIQLVDTTGKKLGNVAVVTHQNGDANATTTVTSVYPGLNGAASDAQVAKLVSAAGISGYGQKGLTDAQKANNVAAINNAAYGATVTYTVAVQDTKPAFTSANLLMNTTTPAGGLGSEEPTADAYLVGTSKSGSFSSLKASFLNDAALKAADGAYVTADNVMTALKNNGLDSAYAVYDTTDGKWLTNESSINSNLNKHDLRVIKATATTEAITKDSHYTANTGFKVAISGTPSFAYTVSKKTITNFSDANYGKTFAQLYSQAN